MVAVTNVDGSNPGPNISNTPDTVQSSIGNIQKVGLFTVALAPTSVAANTTAEQTFTSTGVGLQVGDLVVVNKPTAQAGLGIVNVRVSDTDTLAVTYVNVSTAAITPTTESYLLDVNRIQSNWTKPASGNQMDW